MRISAKYYRIYEQWSYAYLKMYNFFSLFVHLTPSPTIRYRHCSIATELIKIKLIFIYLSYLIAHKTASILTDGFSKGKGWNLHAQPNFMVWGQDHWMRNVRNKEIPLKYWNFNILSKIELYATYKIIDITPQLEAMMHYSIQYIKSPATRWSVDAPLARTELSDHLSISWRQCGSASLHHSMMWPVNCD